MRRRPKDSSISAVELLEQAFHALRTSPLETLLCYYIGSIPFVLMFLYFVADMSRSPYAALHCVPAAAGLAAAYAWMKTWQTVFARRLLAHTNRATLPSWSAGRILRMTAIQTAIQPTSLVLVPLSSLIMLPLGWVVAFYDELTVLGDGDSLEHTGKVIARAARQANLWPWQNHMLLAIMSGLTLFVFGNIAYAALLVPQLLKSLFGIETVFTRSGLSLLNTTFLITITALTYLCVDPLMKAVYTLRCYYGMALRSGADIRSDFRAARAPLLLLAALLLAMPGSVASAAEPAAASPVVAADDLDQAIEDVLSRPEYTWRMPREIVQPEEDRGFFATAIEWVADATGRALRSIGRAFQRLLKWIGELFKSNKPPHKPMPDRDVDWVAVTNVLLLVLLAAAASVLAVALWRSRARRRRGADMQATPVATARPDISSEQTTADELPEDEWSALAIEYASKGEYRLAIRALYFAALAGLAGAELIAIARFKSNRDYLLELSRNAGGGALLVNDFAGCVAVFDRVWYGEHAAVAELFASYRASVDALRRGCAPGRGV